MGSKNYNLGYTDLGRNPNSVLITRGNWGFLWGKKKTEDEVNCFKENFIGADEQS